MKTTRQVMKEVRQRLQRPCLYCGDPLVEHSMEKPHPCSNEDCDCTQFDGGGAGSQDPSDEAQQRPLRGSMPSPATARIDGPGSGSDG